jgi:anti-sigma factor RsiW
MDLTLKTKMVVEALTVKVKVKDSIVIRHIRFRLTAELDAVAAQAIGPDAVAAREGILDGGMSKVVVPIDALQTRAQFEGDVRKIEIASVHGIKAVMSRGPDGATEDDDDSDEPSAQDIGDETPARTAVLSLEFECSLGGNDDALVFLAKAMGTAVDVKFTPAQGELPLGGGRSKVERLAF